MSNYKSQTQQRKLPEDALATVAERRVRGSSWAELGAEYGWTGGELRNAIQRLPEFHQELEFAKHEFFQECEGRTLMALREKLRSENEMVSLKAAMALVKFIAAKQRDASREKMTSLRAEIAHARANTSDAKPTAKPNTTTQPREVTPPASMTVTPHATTHAKPKPITLPTGAVVDLSVAPLG